MPKSTRNNPALDAAIQQHRAVLNAVREAIAAWAVKADGRRDSIANGMIQLVGECGTDKDGDDTLEVLSQFFDEYAERLREDRGSVVAHAVAKLAQAAHNLARAKNVRVVN